MHACASLASQVEVPWRGIVDPVWAMRVRLRLSKFQPAGEGEQRECSCVVSLYTQSYGVSGAVSISLVHMRLYTSVVMCATVCSLSCSLTVRPRARHSVLSRAMQDRQRDQRSEHASALPRSLTR
jgi:hypothetical protein